MLSRFDIELSCVSLKIETDSYLNLTPTGYLVGDVAAARLCGSGRNTAFTTQSCHNGNAHILIRIKINNEKSMCPCGESQHKMVFGMH